MDALYFAMAKKNLQDSHFTCDVKNLVNRLNDRTSQKDSVLDRAVEFFANSAEIQNELNSFKQQSTVLNADLSSSASAKKQSLQAEIDKLTANKLEYKQQIAKEGQSRHHHLREVCYQLFALCEGESFEETLRKSAQLLGTIQLISPTEGKDIANVNERHKPIYKAVLCLRLLDELIISNQLDDPYITKYLADVPNNKYQHFNQLNSDAYKTFVEQVKLPIVMAALVQDIGNFHPDAQAILVGAHGKDDPYRTLELEDRKALLQISFREMHGYITEGLAELVYIGNSRAEKNLFVQHEQEKMQFLKRLLKSAISPKNGIGNILKVPQIYTSIILSTKANYNYKVLPKVYHVLNLNAERGACAQSVVDALYKITGMFPQGYGITYIPKALDNSYMDFYEYAVVSQLYPSHPEEPICRQATKKLSFISFGQDIHVIKESNLYFVETAKRFSRVSKKRLLEILEQMVSNFEERKELDILPRCWLPNDYFSVKNHQKLWNRAVE